MMYFNIEIIEGVMLGFEHVYLEEENMDYYMIDFFILRLIFEKEREDA